MIRVFYHDGEQHRAVTNPPGFSTAYERSYCGLTVDMFDADVHEVPEAVLDTSGLCDDCLEESGWL